MADAVKIKEQPLGSAPGVITHQGVVEKKAPVAEKDVVDPVYGKPKTKEEMAKILAPKK